MDVEFDEDDVFEEVDEEKYQEITKSRREAGSFVVDDNGLGYQDDGEGQRSIASLFANNRNVQLQITMSKQTIIQQTETEMSANNENNEINSKQVLETFGIVVTSTTKSFADLTAAIFCNIFEYLDWYDVGRFDNALLNRNARNRYLHALKIRKVKVEQNRFWNEAVDRGILKWLISRNICVICWNLSVNYTELMTIVNGLPQLQSFDTSGCLLGIRDSRWWDCRDITDEAITALARGLPQLQSLNISDCHDITDVGITALARGLHQLQSLNICCCDKITVEGIRTLASGLLPRLQSLNIGGCNITDEGLIVLASGLPQLQSLNIKGSYNITDEGIRALASELLPQLQSLDVSDCGNITDEGIRAVASGCPQLQSLNISHCGKITYIGIMAIVNGLPQLQSLDISYDRMTDAKIKAIVNGMRQLQSLNMSHCREITDEGIKAVANGLRQLQSLNISSCMKIGREGEEIAKRINSSK